MIIELNLYLDVFGCLIHAGSECGKQADTQYKCYIPGCKCAPRVNIHVTICLPCNAYPYSYS